MTRLLIPFSILIALALPVRADEPVKVGVYAGPGTSAAGVTLLEKALGGQSGWTVKQVAADDLATGLAGVDVLVVGGSSGSKLARGLKGKRAAALTAWVKKGGAYVGVGAGAYLAARGYNAATRAVQLLDARVVAPKRWKRGTGLVGLKALVGKLPALWQFQNGPLFAPARGHQQVRYEAWARFDPASAEAQVKIKVPADAIVRGPLGKGRVVLFSVHAHQRPDTLPTLLEAIRWAAQGSATAATPRVPSAGALRVAVLDDQGCIDACVVMSFACLDAVKGRFWVRRVSGREVAGGALAFYDVVILPGGSATKQSRGLGSAGRKALKAFVAKGGGYVGICAGAYLAASEPKRYGLGLAAVRVVDTKHWRRGEGIAELETLPGLASVTGAQGKSLRMLYANGPLLEAMAVEGLPAATPLAKFVSDIAKHGAPKGMMPGKLAVASAEFKRGKVVLFSTHPELTKGLGGMLVRSVLWSAGKAK